MTVDVHQCDAIYQSNLKTWDDIDFHILYKCLYITNTASWTHIVNVEHCRFPHNSCSWDTGNSISFAVQQWTIATRRLIDQPCSCWLLLVLLMSLGWRCLVYCLHTLMHFNERTTPKWLLPVRGKIRASTWLYNPTGVFIPNRTQTHRQIYHATSVAAGRIFALSACDAV